MGNKFVGRMTRFPSTTMNWRSSNLEEASVTQRRRWTIRVRRRARPAVSRIRDWRRWRSAVGERHCRQL